MKKNNIQTRPLIIAVVKLVKKKDSVNSKSILGQMPTLLFQLPLLQSEMKCFELILD